MVKKTALAMPAHILLDISHFKYMGGGEGGATMCLGICAVNIADMMIRKNRRRGPDFHRRNAVFPLV